MKEYKLIIGGERVAGSGGTYEVINPATEEVVGEAPEASSADAHAAAQAARDAAPAWRRTSPENRANLLMALAVEIKKRSDDLLPLIMAETGATLKVGTALQIPQAVSRFERYARGALLDISIPLPPSIMSTTPLAAGGVIGGVGLRQPVGVVACISPYNFPLVNMAGKVGPALATGNTVVMKPAPQDPLAIIEFAEICEAVGFPAGVVNVITSSTPDSGAALVDSKNIDMISFTGSTEVGVKIFAAGGKTMKRLLLELGGKGAAIVRQDADLAKAIAGLMSVWGFHSGQICTAPTRAIVHRSVYEALVAGLASAAPQLKVGPPDMADTVVGPVISGAQRDRIEQEIFGPVIVVVPYDDDDEAIAIANDSDYGLYDYVFSEDTAAAYAMAQQLEAGHVGINTAQRNHEAPFGGFKMSGVGRDGGDFGLYAYTEMQSIVWPG